MPGNPVYLSDAELVARLTQTEDSFVERKSHGDRGGWLRTVVAFANSTPIGLPAVLFVGVEDDGQIEDHVNIERVMQTFSDYVDAHVWPPIFTLPRALSYGGKSCVAVIVPGSADRPHFAGRSWVRRGTQTKDASAEQFAELVAARNSKAREILAWVGKEISFIRKRRLGSNHQFTEHPVTVPVKVRSCGPHYATFSEEGSLTRVFSEPLGRIEIGFDDVRNRLWIYVYEDR